MTDIFRQKLLNLYGLAKKMNSLSAKTTGLDFAVERGWEDESRLSEAENKSEKYNELFHNLLNNIKKKHGRELRKLLQDMKNEINKIKGKEKSNLTLALKAAHGKGHNAIDWGFYILFDFKIKLLTF